MPKIIAQLREDILSNARQILSSEGYNTFTMRSVAAACHVAVGTVYNYFPSKVMVVAEVILEDWKAALLRMDTPAEGETPLEGLGRIFEELMVFYDKYEALWKEYAAGNAAPPPGRLPPPAGGEDRRCAGPLRSPVLLRPPRIFG